MTKDTLYYDGACPLCRREITHLKKIADDDIEFVNIHDRSLARHEMNRQETESRLKILHLETATGTVLKGLDANVAVWQHTRWGFLFRPLRWPLISQVADWVYDQWANRRFNRLYPNGYKNPESISQPSTCSNATTVDTAKRILR